MNFEEGNYYYCTYLGHIRVIQYREGICYTRAQNHTGVSDHSPTYVQMYTNFRPATEKEIEWFNSDKTWEEFNRIKENGDDSGMNWKHIGKNDVFYCDLDNPDYRRLVRLNGNAEKCESLCCNTGESFSDHSTYETWENHRLANLAEQVKFYNTFGYKSDTGEVWKVGDRFKIVGGGRDSQKCEIYEFFLTGGKISAATNSNKTCGHLLDYFKICGSDLAAGNIEHANRILESEDIPERPADPEGYTVCEFREPVKGEFIISGNENDVNFGKVVHYCDDYSQASIPSWTFWLVDCPKYGKKRWIVCKINKYDSLISYLEENNISEEEALGALGKIELQKRDDLINREIKWRKQIEMFGAAIPPKADVHILDESICGEIPDELATTKWVKENSKNKVDKSKFWNILKIVSNKIVGYPKV